MVKRTIGLLCLLFLFPCISHCQITLRGKVLERSTNEPICGANVCIYSNSPDLSMVAYDVTNRKGEFTISTKEIENADSVLLAVTYMGYAKHSSTVGTKGENINISMMRENFALNEVKIRAQGITQRNDTVTYLVSALASKQDRTISDLLRKLPGIEVNKNGTILYQGKSINRFYIEGVDLLGSQYSLATESIPTSYVSTIQVLENHQPVKALNGKEWVENAAINISLKDDAKSRWVGTTNLGVGVPLLGWEGQLVLMEVARKLQSLNTYKGNNIGNDVTTQAVSHTLESLTNSINNSIDEQPFFAIPSIRLNVVDDSRSLFNVSHQVSTSNASILKRDITLKGNLLYSKSDITQNKRTNYSYFLNSDSTLSVVETLDQRERKQVVTGELIVSRNNSKQYLNSSTKGELNLNDNYIVNGGSFDVAQQFSTPTYKLSNDFKYVLQSGKSTFQVTSFNLVSREQLKLIVDRNKSDNTFDNMLASKTLKQIINKNTIFSNSSASTRWGYRKWSIVGELSMRYLNQTLETELQPASTNTTDFANNVVMQTTRLGVTPKISYNTNRFKVEFAPSYYLLGININDKELNRPKNDFVSYFNPKLSVKYDLNSDWTLHLNYSKSNKQSDLKSVASHYVMQDYRTLSKGFISYFSSSNERYALGVSYRNAINMVFGNATVFHVPSESNISQAQQFMGMYVVKSTIFDPQSTKYSGVSGRLGKGFDWKKLNVSLSLVGSRMGTQINQQQARTPCVNYLLSINPQLSLSLVRWLNFEYEGKFQYNLYQATFTSSSISSRSKNYLQKASLFIYPTSTIQVSSVFEHIYMNDGTYTHPNCVFVDLAIRYITPKIELSLNCNNISNQKNYTYSNRTQLNQTVTEYGLRESSIMLSVFVKF